MITIQSPDGSERHCVDDADWKLWYPEWTKLADGAPLGDASVLENGAWNDLPEVQTRKWERVKQLRADKLLLAPTPFGTAQCDDESKNNINGLVQMATLAKAALQPYSEVFTMADNSEVTLDADQMITFGIAVGGHVASVYANARALRAAIYATDATIEAVSAVDVEAGWP